jgi:murein DD-endopeptidase MepM/ murein hydrolase activator NlpD
MALTLPLPGGVLTQRFGPSLMSIQPSMWYRRTDSGIESAYWVWYQGANGFSTDCHAGVDFAGMPEGSPLRAAESGRIVRREYDRYNGGGNVIRVAIRPGVYYEYAHCAWLTSKGIGSIVRKGETIAGVGRTGTVTGVHVHANVLINQLGADGVVRPILRNYLDFIAGGKYADNPKIKPIYV